MNESVIQQYTNLIESTNSKWLKFSVAKHTGKTFKFDVFTEDGYILLGEIRWYGSWRCYAFFPSANTLFERECMRTIADVCERMTRDHKNGYVSTRPIKNSQQSLEIAASTILRTQDALDLANSILKKNKLLGVSSFSVDDMGRSRTHKKRVQALLDTM